MLVTVVEHFMVVPSPEHAVGNRSRSQRLRAAVSPDDGGNNTGTDDDTDWRGLLAEREHQLLRSNSATSKVGSATTQASSPPIYDAQPLAAALSPSDATSPTQETNESPSGGGHPRPKSSTCLLHHSAS